MKIDTDLLVDALHALSGARQQGVYPLVDVAERVMIELLEELARERYCFSALDFSLLANVYEELRPHIDPKRAMLLGAEILDARPDARHELPAEHFTKLGALFSTVVTDAIKHRTLTQTAALTFSDVLRTSISGLDIEHQRPYLEASRKISCAGGGALSTTRGVRRPLKGFFFADAGLQRTGAEMAQNQALMVILEGSLKKSVRKVEPDDCLTGGAFHAQFDEFIAAINGWSKAGINFKMTPSDTLLVGQVLELMATVISKERGTLRADTVEEGLLGLVAMVVRKTGKITAQTSDYEVKAEDHPMAESGDEITSFQGYLLATLKASMALETPPACQKALERYRMHVLLHAAAITPALRENNPEYDGEAFIKALIKLSGPALQSRHAITRLSEEGRSVVSLAVDDPVVRRRLAEQYLTVCRDMFISDLNL